MIHDLMTFSALKERMRFLQHRQKLLAENVANADTPGYKPKDIAPLGVDAASRGADSTRYRAVNAYGGRLGLMTTDGAHLGGSNRLRDSDTRGASYETRPSGNAVNIEDEMLKVSQNQIDYQTAANIYQRGISTLKIALGRKA